MNSIYCSSHPYSTSCFPLAVAVIVSVVFRLYFLFLQFSCIVMSSGSSWHCVETTAANKATFSCDEDLMCLSDGTNGICLPLLLLLSKYSAQDEDGGMHLLIVSWRFWCGSREQIYKYGLAPRWVVSVWEV